MNQTPKPAPKRGLGRGFEALLSQDFDKTSLLSNGERIEKISVTALRPNPHQPRKEFNDQALADLAASIKQHGIMQPLVVTPDGKNYVLIAGERRWRAAQLAGLTEVPVISRTTKDIERLELALIENVQRVDLSPLEQAASIEQLHNQFSLGYEAIAKRLGKAVSTVNNSVRLLNLPAAARQALADQKISEGHARAILALKGDDKRQDYLLQTIIARGWSVRQAERFVSSVKQGVTEPTAAHKRSETETPATKALSKRLGTPVHVRHTAKGGKLEISFKTDDELANLLQRIN